MDDLLVRMNNRLTRLRRVRVPAASILVLAPRCLQARECQADLQEDILHCQRCGRCRCSELRELTTRYGVRTLLAGGGMEALAAARAPQTRAVVAIACRKELRAGISAVFPKPVWGVVNLQPNGPCRNTDVVLSEVEAALRMFLDSESPKEKQNE